AARMAPGQGHVAQAPAVVALTAVIARTAARYGYRSYRYTHWDAGHAGQNIYLTAEALGLATVAVGAYYDSGLCKLLRLDCISEIPMLLYHATVPCRP
nr:SagB/ThcOx family dehydrogenase [Desulfurococcales archaeon]